MSPRAMGPRRDAAALPRWAAVLLERLGEPGRGDEVVGDLEEVHGERVARRGRALATLLTTLEAADLAVALLRERRRRRRAIGASGRTARAAGGPGRIPTASWLDFKLGLRMLARYPSLTLVAVVAMAFGIAVGAGAFELVKDQLFPPLPYRDAARIVRIENVDARTTRPAPRALHDLARWREGLRTVEQLSAVTRRERNLWLGGATAGPVAETAVSATAFHLVRVAPLLGRPLVPADEAPGAPGVVVIGWELWQRRFAGDPHVVGRTVRLGGEQATVVGVMPRDFAFHLPGEGMGLPAPQELWVPFRLRPLDHRPGEGPAIELFGRLAPGATPAALQAELSTLAAAAAAEWPETHEHLVPRVATFADRFVSDDGLAPTGVLTLSAAFLVTLMAVVCCNVALLLFARAATREGEIAVRNALGASRSRIVAQLLAEAVVLAGVAVVVGVVGAAAGLHWAVGVLRSMLQAQGVALPSWIGDALSPSTILYAVALAAVGAVVAGVLPGLKVTGRGAQASIQRVGGRGSGVRLGGVWTGIIVTQVVLTVMLVPIAAVVGMQSWRMRTAELGLADAEYLAVRLAMEGEPEALADAARLAAYERSYRALARRVAAEPGVVGVTVADQVPGGWHPSPPVQLDGSPALPDAGWAHHAQRAAVDHDFFAVMGATIVAGRALSAADIAAGARAVVVNESFVREHLGGRNAVGRRIRYPDQEAPDGAGPWHTIIGVVRDLAMTMDPTRPHNAGVYHPLRPGDTYPVRLAVRLTGERTAFAGRLYELAAESAPALRLQRPVRVHEAARANLLAYDAWFRVIALGGAMALLLTNAGIYAIISFTVSRRTREIGVRVALGADRRQIAAAILSRTARHVGLGILVGAALGTALAFGLSEGGWRPSALQVGALLLAYMMGMMGACLTAGVVPMRRALRIQPTEALAAE
jgi:predicted permease